jgi:hypothetical protein
MPPEPKDPIAWALDEARRLRGFSVDSGVNLPVGAPKLKYASIGDLSPAAQFLNRYAPNSHFARSASMMVQQTDCWDHAHAMADLLTNWVEYKRAGMQDDAPFEVRARVEAANDLMDQVDTLLNDRRVHPAAPIVLAGAALEERLRALMLEKSLFVPGKPGLDAYSAELKKANVLDGQEAKQVTAWAGLRNQAAHGEDLEKLTVEEARIMRDGVNLFLQKHALGH